MFGREQRRSFVCCSSWLSVNHLLNCFCIFMELTKQISPGRGLITKHPLRLAGPHSSNKEPLILDFHYAVWTTQKTLKFAFGLSIAGTILMSLPPGKFLSMVSHRWHLQEIRKAYIFTMWGRLSSWNFTARFGFHIPKRHE